jgi:hypothetical protein
MTIGIRLGAGALAVLILTGCQTFGGGGPSLTMVTTDPEGALVKVEGFGECEAPCTIELDAARNITVAKAGYRTQRFVLMPGKRNVEVALELSAPTTGVDKTELPDL